MGGGRSISGQKLKNPVVTKNVFKSVYKLGHCQYENIRRRGTVRHPGHRETLSVYDQGYDKNRKRGVFSYVRPNLSKSIIAGGGWDTLNGQVGD